MPISPADSRKLLVELPIRVKTYDIDWVGHVNNIVYLRWLEDLRLQLLDVYYPLEDLLAEGYSPIVMETNIRYRQGIVLADKQVIGRMWSPLLERATLHLEAEFMVGDEVRCSATQRGCFVESDTMRLVRLPTRLREAYDAS